MIDPDVELPRIRERLLMLCSLLAQSINAESQAALTKQIEQTALDIGFVSAVDLVQNGWKPDQRQVAQLKARNAVDRPSPKAA